MKAVKYKVEIVDGVLDMTHGLSHTITEYYLPDTGIVFNFYGEVVHAFKSSPSARHAESIEEVEIDNDLARRLSLFVGLQDDVKKDLEKLYGQ